MSQGDACHIELSTTDLHASRGFYRNVFGWAIEDVPGMEGYVSFRMPGGLGGGLKAAASADPPSNAGPILHIEVNDIEATLRPIVTLGGAVLAPNPRISDEFGYFALSFDSVGNRLGLWSRT